jgi:hypothetical protein
MPHQNDAGRSRKGWRIAGQIRSFTLRKTLLNGLPPYSETFNCPAFMPSEKAASTETRHTPVALQQLLRKSRNPAAKTAGKTKTSY